MNITIVKVGYLETNCYILEKDNKCLVIDPGDEVDKILLNIKYDLIGILVTHCHSDHIGALEDLLKYKNVNVYNQTNLKEGNINIGPFNLEVIFTKGHTNDSITYYFYEDNVMFVGDFIFYESIGRTDLPTGNNIDMKNSIKKIINYNEKTTIYPGHGIKTSLEYEIKNNKYIKEESI